MDASENAKYVNIAKGMSSTIPYQTQPKTNKTVPKFDQMNL